MVRARNTMRQLLRKTVIFLIAVVPVVHAQGGLPYTTYTSFTQVLEGRNAHYAVIARVSDPGPSGDRAYTGFFFTSVSSSIPPDVSC